MRYLALVMLLACAGPRPPPAQRCAGAPPAGDGECCDHDRACAEGLACHRTADRTIGECRPAVPARCPDGTCRRAPGAPCEAPSGPLGNACCGCGEDGMCSSLCRCAAPTTLVATPDGERPIASLRAGDRVFSVHRGALVAVPILETHRGPVRDHHVVRVELASGRVLEISPGHPTADGRAFADLAAGDRIDGITIVSLAPIPYAYDATYDVLPASDSGTYIAEGVLVGSTLRR